MIKARSSCFGSNQWPESSKKPVECKKHVIVYFSFFWQQSSQPADELMLFEEQKFCFSEFKSSVNKGKVGNLDVQ